MKERDWSRVDWKHQVAVEYGITDRFELAVYNVLRQKPYDTLSYDGLKVRGRYRFSDEGKLAIDPAIYFEVGYAGDAVKFEQILILGKRFGGFELAFNAKGEQEYSIRDKKWEFELQPLLGIGYHFNEHVSLGLEYKGVLKIEGSQFEYFANYLGPAVSIAAGPVMWTTSVMPQLGAREGLSQVQIRSLAGLRF